MISKLINEAELDIDKIIDELRGGFIICQRCGDQEQTSDLDVMSDLIELKKTIQLIGACS